MVEQDVVVAGRSMVNDRGMMNDRSMVAGQSSHCRRFVFLDFGLLQNSCTGNGIHGLGMSYKLDTQLEPWSAPGTASCFGAGF